MTFPDLEYRIKADPGLATAGVFRIEQAMPFGSGGVNLYILPGPPPVLIDSGWRGPSGLAGLAAALEQTGVDARRVAHVLLTHAHLDHAGGAVEMARRYGIQVWAHADEAPRLDGRQYSYLIDSLPALFRRFGLDPAAVRELTSRLTGPAQGYRLQDIPCFQRLAPDTRLPVTGLDLEVIATPGHSRGSVCFLDRGRNLLFSGDTLTADSPPRAILSPETEKDISFDGLLNLKKSLATLAAAGPTQVFGGHGPPGDLATLTATATRAMNRLRDGVLKRLEPATSVLMAANGIRLESPVAALMRLGEIRAALEALLRTGLIRLELKDGVEWFSPVPDPPPPAKPKSTT